MKRLLTAAALAALAAPASADVSEDLKFCGGRKSAPERLACFEAVTRGASKHGPTPPAARAVAPQDALAAIPTKAPPLDPLPARNPFDGYYAAIGGGYGIGTKRDASARGNYTFGSGDLSLPATEGASIDLVVGRNIPLGWGLVGIEIDGRFGGDRGSSIIPSFPDFRSSAVGTGTLSYKYRNDAAVHAGIRAGVVFDDLLIFAKGGVGANRIRESFTADERGVSIFICPTLSPFNSCFSPGAPTPGLNSVQTISWLPSAILGLGVEKTWGPVFGRLGADFEAVNHPSTAATAIGVAGSSSSAGQLTWTARGTALIGVRF
jgi:opacity protein-like surface antigen